jgi:hypothetical protein
VKPVTKIAGREHGVRCGVGTRVVFFVAPSGARSVPAPQGRAKERRRWLWSVQLLKP